MHAIPTMELHSGRNAVFAINSERNRPHIFIEIFNQRDQSWKVIHCLADSGNDINLFNIEEASKLGIDPVKQGREFKVAGISGEPDVFYMVDIMMKIKETSPFKARAGFGKLRDNLLGRETVFQRFDVVYSPDHVSFWERRHAERMAAYAGRYSYR
jgi:hypothetical protein